MGAKENSTVRLIVEGNCQPIGYCLTSVNIVNKCSSCHPILDLVGKPGGCYLVTTASTQVSVTQIDKKKLSAINGRSTAVESGDKVINH